jgi:hypothetical protein
VNISQFYLLIRRRTIQAAKDSPVASIALQISYLKRKFKRILRGQSQKHKVLHRWG